MGRSVVATPVVVTTRHRHLHPERTAGVVVADPPSAKQGKSRTPDGEGMKNALPAPFVGIDFDTSGGLNGGALLAPADPSGAAGPGHLISTVNGSIEILDKSTGGVLQQFSLSAFFASESPAGPPFDARVIYDHHDDRFVVVAADRQQAPNASRLLVAVSQTTDPVTDGWTFTALDALVDDGSNEHFFDFPGLAADADALYLTGNVFQFADQSFPGLYGGSYLLIVDKTDLYAGVGATVIGPVDATASTGCFSNVTHQPAMVIGAAPGSLGTFLVGFDGITNAVQQFAQVIRIDDPLTAPVFTCDLVALGPVDSDINDPLPDAPQADPLDAMVPVPKRDIETNGRRILSAAYRSDRLFAATTVNSSAAPDQGQATVLWMEIDTTSPVNPLLARSGTVGGEDIASGTHTYYPSISVNSDGGVVIGFSASAPTLHAGSYFTLRSDGDSNGSTRGSVEVAPGADYYQRTLGGSKNRWGDYSTTSVDPAAGCFWIYNQFADTPGNATPGDADDDGRWGTAFTRYCNESPTALPDAIDLDLAVSDTATVLADGSTTSLLANDTDPDINIASQPIDALLLFEDPMTTSGAVVEPLHGSLTLNPSGNGTFSYVNDGSPNLDVGGDPIILPDGTADMDDSFVYRACDDGSPTLCDDALVSISVASTNHVPLAVDDAISLDEGTTDTDTGIGGVNLLANDLNGVDGMDNPMIDPGQVLRITEVTADGNTVTAGNPVTTAIGSTLTVQSNGSYSYTHDGSEVFADDFTYVVCDDGALPAPVPVLCRQGMVTVTINPINENPQPADDSMTVLEGGTTTLLDGGATSLLDNDVDPDNAMAMVQTLTILTGPIVDVVNGTLSLSADGTFSYTHDGGETTSDGFTYRACDDGTPVLCTDAAVTIAVTPDNDPPNTQATTLTVTEGGTQTQLDGGETLLINLVTDDEGNGFSVTEVSPAIATSVGSIQILGPDGSFTYIHDGSEVFTDSFSYEACDDVAPVGTPIRCESNSVTITVTPVDDLPVANVESIMVTEGGVAVTLVGGETSVLANDVDDDSTLTAELLTGPTNNSVSQPFVFVDDIEANGGGTFQYTHDGSEVFTDSFSYRACEVGGLARCTNSVTVTINVNSVNEAPTASVDGFVVDEGALFPSGTLNLLDNDSDPDGDTLFMETIPVVNAGLGALNLTADGNFDYTHDGTEPGAAPPNDSFTYRVCDRMDALDPDRLCSDAVVNITVSQVNDPPTANDDPFADLAEDDPAQSFDVLANDDEGPGESQTLSLVSVSGAVGGAAVILGGQIQFTPAGDFNGAASFQYTMQDDGSEGAPGFLQDSATATFTITEVNDAPVPADDTLPDAIEDTTAIIDPADLIGNDDPGAADESGQSLVVSEVSNPLGGTVSINVGTGMIEFEPTPAFNGPASFDYRITDDGTTSGAADPLQSTVTATVSFNVAPGNDPPVAGDDGGPDTPEDTAQVIFLLADLLANDTATPGEIENISITAVDNPIGGSVVLNVPSARVEFGPTPDFFGAASFTYTLSDDAGGGAGGIMTDQATVSFTITEVNDDPVAMDDNLPALMEDTTYVIPFADIIDANDNTGAANEAAQTLTLISVGNESNGTATVVGMTVEFVPTMDFTGPASFEYTIEDDGTTNGAPDPRSDTATVSFLVEDQFDPPVAVNDQITAVPDVAATFLNGGAGSVLDNDLDPDSILMVAQVTGTTTEPAGTPVTTNGGATVTVQADGTFSYLYSGAAPAVDSFDYQVCDDTVPVVQCDTATVDVSILDAGAVAACAPGGRRTVVGIPANIDTSSAFTGTQTSYMAAGLPISGNLVINTSSGVIFGIPDAGDQAGSPYDVTVTTDDAQTFMFRIVVDAGLETVFYTSMEDSCVGI